MHKSFHFNPYLSVFFSLAAYISGVIVKQLLSNLKSKIFSLPRRFYFILLTLVV